MSPIAVTGMHRTGTSMVGKALMLAGLHLGRDDELVRPAPDNVEGFFEHEGLVRLNDDLLGATGGAWDNPPACPPFAADDPRVAHLTSRATDLIASLSAERPWGWKDPRTCLTARFWIDLVPDLRAVICVRHPLEVALSLKRRNQISYSLALRLWHDYYEAVLGAVPVERRLVTHYDAHFKDASGSAERLLAFAGLDIAAVDAAVPAFDGRLRHHDLDVTLAAAGASPAIVGLYERLCVEAGLPPEASSAIDSRADADAGRVERAVLDLELARQHLDRRDRRIAALERERDELRQRLAALEATSASTDLLTALAERIDGLHDAFETVRYERRASGDPAVKAAAAVRDLVRAHVHRGTPVLVVCKGDPELLDLYGRPASSFPQGADGRYAGFWPADGSAAVAHLEALRAEGNKALLLPEAYRWWLDAYPQVAAHLGRYHVLADEPGSGLLVDLETRRRAVTGWPADLVGVLDRLSADAGRSPSILDWTERALGERLVGRNVFRPHDDGPALPYLDRSVDVVVVEEPARVEEARRVAVVAVVALDAAARPQAVVDEVVVIDEGTPHAAATVDVVVRGLDTDAAAADAAAADAVREALATEPVGELVTGDDWPVAGHAELVAFLDPGAVPLPGALAAARRTFERDDRCGAVAVKLFGRQGDLAAAGVTVFRDGTWAGVAAGSFDPCSPWHERVRPTSAGVGMLVVRRAALADVAGPGPGPAGLVDLAGDLWGGGWRVLYQPEASAVQTRAASDEMTESVVGGAWAESLQRRPPRPEPLDDAAWRSLLLTDDVAGSGRS